MGCYVIFYHLINPSGAEVNTMAADALALYIARASTITVLTMQDKQIFVFNQAGFQLHASL